MSRRSSADRAARSSAVMSRARASTEAVSPTSNGLTSSAAGHELVVGPRLAGEGEHAVVGVDERSFFGHQVHPVAHRVHQQDVVAGQRGQRRLVVVLDLEDDRCPPRRGEPLVDAVHGGLDLVLVGQVFGQSLAGGVSQRHEHHPAASARLGLEQLLVGPKAAQQVLDSSIRSTRAMTWRPVAHPVVDAGQGPGHGRIGGRLGQSSGSTESGDTKVRPGRVPAGADRSASDWLDR